MWWQTLLSEDADPGVPVYLWVLFVIFLLMAIFGWGGLIVHTVRNRRKKK